MRRLFLLFILFHLALASSEASNSTKGIALASWKFHHLSVYITLTVFIMCVVIVKLVYEYVEVISSVVPESCILILIGVLFGVILRFGLHETKGLWSLTPDLFLLILLPPIVLDSAHGLSQRAFGDILGSVLLFAGVGTILNFLIIGFTLFGLNSAGAMGSTPAITLSHCLLFGSLIVAVDPVAVLAIFEELGVDKTLYFLVFGESLLNDAVTIVLYNMIIAFVQMDVVTPLDVATGVGSFFTVSLGGALIGLLFGVASCLLTRCTSHYRLIEPLVITTLAYLSYLMGDLVGWSGIISMIACGVLQSTYAFHNMAPKSVTVTRRSLKILAKLSESVIFFFLGISIISGKHSWDTGFILWALILCLIVRFLITFLMSSLLNKTGSVLKKISFTQQLIIGYGGLRGAVSFSLASMITDKVMRDTEMEKETFITATLFIVIFTILPMGLTIKPLVKLLKIRLEEITGLSLIGEITCNACDHFSAGMEAIAGIRGQNSFREWLDNFDQNHVRPCLQNRPEINNQGIIDVYEKVALMLHYATMRQHEKSNPFLDKLSAPLKDKFLLNASKVNLEMEQDAAEDEDEDENAGVSEKPHFNGLGALLTITNHDSSCDFHREREKKRRFALKRLDLKPEVNPEDYASLLKVSLRRQNALDGTPPQVHHPSEDHWHHIRENLRRKNALLAPVLYRDEVSSVRRRYQRGLSEPPEPRPFLQRQKKMRRDSDSRLAVTHESAIPEVTLEMSPHTNPSFRVGPDSEENLEASL